MRNQLLRTLTLFASLFLATSSIQAGFVYGDDLGLGVQPGTTAYNILKLAISDLAEMNPEAGNDLWKMLNNPEGSQLNIGLPVTNAGAQIDTSGALTLADGEPGVEGDGINVNNDVLYGRYQDSEGHWHNSFDPDNPSTCSGSSWNNLVSALAHEWVHCTSNAQTRPMPNSANHSAITDYCWEKPAYEKQMEVLLALGERDGFYNGPNGPTKTYLERLEQELARKRKAAEEEMWRKGFGGDFSLRPSRTGAGGCFFAGARNTANEPVITAWSVDGNMLYCSDPSEEVGVACALPFNQALDFRPVRNLPRGSDHTILFIAGIYEGTGVILGIEISEAEIVRTVLHLEIAGCEPWSLSYRGSDGSLWMLDGANQTIRTIIDIDGDFIPDILTPLPYATANEWPILKNAQQIASYTDYPGIGVAPVGNAPHDVIQLQQPITFLLDADNDGLADGAVEKRMGELAAFCPRFSISPNASALSCSLIGVAGAVVTLIGCDVAGGPSGEVLGSVTIGADFKAEMVLTRPLIEGEYILLSDPVHDLLHEAAPYPVPPTGTNRPPIVQAPCWQMTWQTTQEGSAVHFDATGTFDPDGNDLNFTWQWLQNSYHDALTLGYGPILDTVLPPGIQPIRLIVDDGTAAIWTYCYAGVLPNGMPVAHANPITVHYGVATTLDASSSTDPDVGDTIVQYCWSCDSNEEYAITSVAATLPVSWEQLTDLLGEDPLKLNSPYPLTLIVTDTHGGTGTTYTTLTLFNVPPTIDPIADVVTNYDDMISVGVTVHDIDSPMSSLVVTATSSNQAIVKDSKIVASGTGTARTLDIIPELTTSGGDVIITVTVTDDGALSASTQFKLTVTKYQPDLSLRPSTVASYSGIGVYNLDGTEQTVGSYVSKNSVVSYFVHVQNKGNTPDTFIITGTSAPAGWSVVYKINNSSGMDITTYVTKTGWTTPIVKPGSLVTIAIYVKASPTVMGNTTAIQTVTVTSDGEATKQDVGVIESTRVPEYKADLSLRPSTIASYTGIGVYNLDGVRQTVGQTVIKNKIVSYFIHVQNKGNAPDTFTITSTSAPAGWSVVYKINNSNGTVITTDVTGAGWMTPLVNANGLVTVAVYIIPGSTVIGGTTATQTVTVTSNGDASQQDVGVIHTIVM